MWIITWNIKTYFLQKLKNKFRVNPFNPADQYRYLCKQIRFRLYTVCHWIFDFTPSGTIDVSKIKDRRDYFRNSGVTGLMLTHFFLMLTLTMPHPFQIFSQSDDLIQIVDINSYTEWQTVQIQISWLLQKATDLALHCLQRQDKSGSAGLGLIFRVKTVLIRNSDNMTNTLDYFLLLMFCFTIESSFGQIKLSNLHTVSHGLASAEF